MIDRQLIFLYLEFVTRQCTIGFHGFIVPISHCQWIKFRWSAEGTKSVGGDRSTLPVTGRSVFGSVATIAMSSNFIFSNGQALFDDVPA